MPSESRRCGFLSAPKPTGGLGDHSEPLYLSIEKESARIYQVGLVAGLQELRVNPGQAAGETQQASGLFTRAGPGVPGWGRTLNVRASTLSGFFTVSLHHFHV